jgi:DcuC family C4-dicarboxylate transporter
MTTTTWIAALVVLIMIVALVKRYEARLVLITAGLALCSLKLAPMDALDAFATSMTNAGLIQAICSAMGFAYVIKYSRCDDHLVALLTKPLGNLGLLLIPASTTITFICCTAITSAAGAAAAVGSTLIPLMIRSGINPIGAAAAVLAGTFGGLLSPGNAHNVFVSKLAKMDVIALITHHAPYSLTMMGISIVGITIVTFLFKDHKFAPVSAFAVEQKADAITTPNVVYALAPFVPLALLLLGNTMVPALKMGIAQAMIIGSILALVITRLSPAKVVKEFFNGMGKAFADVIGIIIAAGVFVAGLKSAGLLDVFINALKNSNEIARWGGSIGPFMMAVIAGSGDAISFAFNESVTPHAAQFGMKIPDLGMLAVISGAMGRTMSPIAGVVIVVAGIAGVSPVDVVKRTAPTMIFAVLTLALIMV